MKDYKNKEKKNGKQMAEARKEYDKRIRENKRLQKQREEELEEASKNLREEIAKERQKTGRKRKTKNTKR